MGRLNRPTCTPGSGSGSGSSRCRAQHRYPCMHFSRYLTGQPHPLCSWSCVEPTGLSLMGRARSLCMYITNRECLGSQAFDNFHFYVFQLVCVSSTSLCLCHWVVFFFLIYDNWSRERKERLDGSSAGRVSPEGKRASEIAFLLRLLSEEGIGAGQIEHEW